MHRQRQLHSSVTVGYSWMYLLLLIYRELMSLLCTLSQPKKKNAVSSYSVAQNDAPLQQG